MKRPYAESCEQNKAVIHPVIAPFLQPGMEVLEIGSGTGQHAVYFAQLNPQIKWQTSDRAEHLPGIQSWITFAELSNLPEPLLLDVSASWPDKKYDILFTANSLHIMSDHQAEDCIRNATGCLRHGGHFIVYGPFNYQGGFTSDSNRQFEAWLKHNDPDSGIKHFEVVDKIAEESGLKLRHDVAMPANNRILIWQYETLT